MGCKLLIEVPVNGGRNYNGPKVAKFLVNLYCSFALDFEPICVG